MDEKIYHVIEVNNYTLERKQVTTEPITRKQAVRFIHTNNSKRLSYVAEKIKQ